MPSFTLFDTPIGRCALAWSANGIVRVLLPEANEMATRECLADWLPQASEALPAPKLRDAMTAINGLLGGRRTDLGFIALDMQGISPFHRRVYEAVRRIPPGATLSYGEVARQIDAPRAARAIGQALGRNPFPLVVPCHRVLAANGRLGGFSAYGGVVTKRLLLSLEKVPTSSELNQPHSTPQP